MSPVLVALQLASPLREGYWQVTSPGSGSYRSCCGGSGRSLLVQTQFLRVGPNISSRQKWMGRQTFASLRLARAFPQAFGVL